MLDLLKVREAWKITRGSEKVLVGIIDNGFDFYHPALKDKGDQGDQEPFTSFTSKRIIFQTSDPERLLSILACLMR